MEVENGSLGLGVIVAWEALDIIATVSLQKVSLITLFFIRIFFYILNTLGIDRFLHSGHRFAMVDRAMTIFNDSQRALTHYSCLSVS